MKWGKILSEYSDSKANIKSYSELLKNENDISKNVELEISRNMYSEISENIGYVKKNYLVELKNFLSKEESSILTKRQHHIMTLRSKGYSMDEIADVLGISKTAVFKSIRLSEKKINSI